MNQIKYVQGNLFDYVKEKDIVIPHIVNTVGAWGAGFVVPLGNYYPKAKNSYLHWSSNGIKTLPFELGENQYVYAESKTLPDAWVVNMLAQRGLYASKYNIPLQYGALTNCLINLSSFCHERNLTKIVAPKFGSGLAGGEWSKIEEIINTNLGHLDLTIVEYVK